jgi:DsbC/DsbD-like thiol-disulfide interchange protein
MAFLVLLLAQLLGAPVTPHIKMTASASVAEARAGTTIRLFVDVTPDPKVHVYAPGAKDYMPIALTITPRAGIKVGKLAYPKSQDWYFEPLKEHVPVFTAPFRLEQPITLGAPLKAGDRVTVAGVLNYQACDDAVCFNPVAAPVSWSVTVK